MHKQWRITVLDLYLGDFSHHFDGAELFIENRADAYITAASLLQQKEFYPNDVVYVFNPKSAAIPDSTVLPVNICLVSDEPPEKLRKSGLFDNRNVMVVPGFEVDLVYDQMKEILLHEYRRFNEALLLFKGVYEADDIQEILDIGYKLIGNPMFVRDTYFKIWGFTQNIHIDDMVWNYITRKGYQEFRDYKHFSSYGILERLNIIGKSIYFDTQNNLPENSVEEYKYHIEERINDPSKYTHINRIWTNIKSGDAAVGQLVVLEAFKKFSHTDIQLMKLITEAVLIVMKKQLNEMKVNQNNSQIFISELLNNDISRQDVIKDRLNYLRWNFSGTLKLILITAVGKKIDKQEFMYTRSWLSNMYKEVRCVHYADDIIVIFNPHEMNNRFSQNKKILYDFLKAQELLIGESREFDNFSGLKNAFDQASIAVKGGMRCRSDERVFAYDDYLLQHIFSIINSNLELKEFCSRSLINLIEYDRQNNTQYVQFLRKYIENLNNPVSLSEAIGVHRNTIYYRINKIEEIMGLSLTDTKNLFEIYLSFEILKYLEV